MGFTGCLQKAVTSTRQAPSPQQGQPASWEWPTDDQVPVDLDAYYHSDYPKQGLSIVKAARACDGVLLGRSNPIVYLVKFFKDAIAERLYYRLARTLDLPQQHVFWGTVPAGDLVAVAIKFYADAFYPTKIDPVAGTVTYRRRVIPVSNAKDFWRHKVLHTFCGSVDINQVMVQRNVIFGIDAADCKPFVRDTEFWCWFINWFRSKKPESLPVILEMMTTIAQRLDLPDLVVQELREAPYPIVQGGGPAHYGAMLRATHDALRVALAKNQNSQWSAVQAERAPAGTPEKPDG